MYNRKFYRNIIIRVILILAICISISFANSLSERWFTTIGLLIILILQLLELLRYIFNVGDSISNFIVSLKNNDLTIPTSGKQSSSINPKFIDNLKELQQRVSYIKSEQVVQALFIENLLEYIEIGIIAILPNGKLKFKNNAVLRLLNIKSFNSVELVSNTHPEFYFSIISIKPGEDKLLTFHSNNEVKKISLKATQFISKEEDIKLVFFQDIKNEIDESLLQSWQNLIRILTHEINNTVSPIASLADSLAIYLSKDGKKNEPIMIDSIDQKSINYSLEGLNIIKERSNGLIDFVSKYKSLLPKKNLTITCLEVGQLFYRLRILFSEKFESKQINFSTSIKSKNLTINADQHYLEQVLINLIGNSIEAFENFTPTTNPYIELISFRGEKGVTIVQVIDNGKGIASENLDKVFIPFYSTKENGTGIGLSLSMQIMHMHNGTIKVQSGVETVFTLQF
jgi:nitrogen fixation/metabolism regulation signal transduction histidine kinase